MFLSGVNLPSLLSSPVDEEPIFVAQIAPDVKVIEAPAGHFLFGSPKIGYTTRRKLVLVWGEPAEGVPLPSGMDRAMAVIESIWSATFVDGTWSVPEKIYEGPISWDNWVSSNLSENSGNLAVAVAVGAYSTSARPGIAIFHFTGVRWRVRRYDLHRAPTRIATSLLGDRISIAFVNRSKQQHDGNESVWFTSCRTETMRCAPEWSLSRARFGSTKMLYVHAESDAETKVL